MYLSPEASALPGRFSFDRAPFQREVFDALSDPNVRRVVIMAASQVLKTQAILNFVGYITHLDPGPVLVVQPSTKMLNSFSKDRLDTLYRDVPELRELIPNKRKRDSGNTIAHKRFPGGYVAMATSNSPADLASRPIRFLFCDETDRYEPTTEGDPIDIAEKRTTTFWNSKIVLTSSPGDEEISRINREFERSDKRYFFVPCHECGEHQRLIWGQVKFDPADTSTTHYECEGCGAKWSDSEKNANVSRGHWETTAKSEVVGFHISALYSSFRTLKNLVDEFLEAKRDPEQLKVFVNTRLAECWQSDSSAVKDIDFFNRLEEYTPDSIPEDVLFLTCGIDVQIDRLELEVVGWGVDEQSWSIEYMKLMGNPQSPAPWMQLKELLDKTYTRNDGLKLKIIATCIDTGGELAPDNIRDFISKSKKTIYPIKGAAGHGKPIFPHKRSRHKNIGAIYIVGVDTAKGYFYTQLRTKEAGPNYCHFPLSYSTDEAMSEYFEGLTSEKCIVKHVRGGRKKVWIKDTTVRNEPLDCRVYALAARKSIQRTDLKAYKERLDKRVEQSQEQKEEPPKEETRKKQPKNPLTQRRPNRSGWISGLD